MLMLLSAALCGCSTYHAEPITPERVDHALQPPRMEKVRAVWARSELEACLDETPFGCYLELEGEPQAIHAAMEGLGLAADRAETRSYPELYRLNGLG